MVRVLSSGEVVSDDDPRSSQRRAGAPQRPPARDPQPPQDAVTGSFSSIWNAGNDRLRQFGLDSFNVAGYRVDPLHLVVAVLGFILSGPMMLAVVVAAIVISQSSGGGGPSTPAQPSVGRAGAAAAMPSSSSQFYAQGDGPQQVKKPRSSAPFVGPGKRLGS